MSSSTHQIKVKAVDNTKAGFNSIAKTATTTSARITKMIGGAVAAAGAYMGTQAIVQSISTLGSLSDIAQRTKTSVEELTQATTAFNILGVQNMGVEQFAKALDRMQKNTGRQGLAGFYETLTTLSKINNLADISSETMRIFGDEAGAFLTPLVEGAKNGVVNLQTVISLMPKISSSAADVGDAFNDSFEIIKAQFDADFKNTLGDFLNWLNEKFPNGIRVATLKALAYWDYYFEKSKNWLNEHAGWITTTFKNLGVGYRVVKSFFTGESSVPTYKPPAKDSPYEKLQKRLDEIDKLAKAYENAAKTISGNNVSKLGQQYSNYVPKNDLTDEVSDLLDLLGGDNNKISNVNQTNANNDLILANTNEALKLAMNHPEINEIKKQTDVLKEIAKNTKETSTNIKEPKRTGWDLTLKELN